MKTQVIDEHTITEAALDRLGDPSQITRKAVSPGLSGDP
jgi:hypothetical protein